MNYYDLEDVKNIRRKMGLTQSEFAKSADVSQSLIAKIEAGKIDPTFSNTKKIFDTLDSLQKKQSLTAKDLIHDKVVSCKEDDKIREVILKMKKHEISQLPVLNDKTVVGTVSESNIVDKLISDPGKDFKAKDVMSDVPPIIALDTRESVISSLLKFFSIVIVQDKGKLKGIITRSDLLRNIYK